MMQPTYFADLISWTVVVPAGRYGALRCFWLAGQCSCSLGHEAKAGPPHTAFPAPALHKQPMSQSSNDEHGVYSYLVMTAISFWAQAA